MRMSERFFIEESGNYVVSIIKRIFCRRMRTERARSQYNDGNCNYATFLSIMELYS